MAACNCPEIVKSLSYSFVKVCFVSHAHSPSWLCSVSNICNSCKVHASMKDSAKCEVIFVQLFDQVGENKSKSSPPFVLDKSVDFRQIPQFLIG